MLALVAAGSVGQAARPAPPARSLLSEALRRFIKMSGALDDRLVIGFVSGRYNGVVDSELTPLFGVFAATFSRYRP